ncbi:MAG: acetyl-CoA carboxylase biotin carboxyl carrier protein subunit [Bacteroidales bacterium]|nr:acetyl-CoA carboxylase biotin carboxyl carrier protein subunit [Bacteroidales bacterium]
MSSEINKHEYKTVTVDDTAYKTSFHRKYKERKPYEPVDHKKVKAVIPGTIVKVFVKPGAKVSEGDPLLTLSAMKMENEVHAPIDGEIKKVYVKPKDVVYKKQMMIEYK